MRYFVVGVDGELYGPADIPTLNQWILEGRLMPTSMLREELGGAQFVASRLPELNFPAGPHTANYPRQGGYMADNGAQELKTAWILGIIGFLCCAICSPIGIVFGFQARKKGNPNATGAIVFCSTITVLNIAWVIYYTTHGGIAGIFKGL